MYAIYTIRNCNPGQGKGASGLQSYPSGKVQKSYGNHFFHGCNQVNVGLWVEKRENIKQAKGNECSQYKSTAAIFSSSLPICPVYFHLVMPRHVLSPCYSRYEHTRGIKGICNILLGMLYQFTGAKYAVIYEVTSAKHAWVSLEKIWMGQMGRLEEKIAAVLLY